MSLLTSSPTKSKSENLSPAGRRRLQRRRGCSVEPVARNRRTAPTLHRGDVIFADFFRQLVAPKPDEGGIFAGVGIQTFPRVQDFHVYQPDEKEVVLVSMLELNDQ